MDDELIILKNNLGYYEKSLGKFINDSIQPEKLKFNLNEFLNSMIQIEEDVFELRIKRIMETENPYLPPVRIELTNYIPKDHSFTLEESIEIFLKLKVRILDYFMHLASNNYYRIGYHWKEGHITMQEIFDRYLQNDKKVRADIEKIIHFKLNV